MHKLLTYLILFIVAPVFCMCNSKEKNTEKINLNEDSVKLVIQNLDNGFKNSDFNILQKSLDENFSISVSMLPSRRYIDPVLEKQGIKSINFVSVDTVLNNLVLVKALVKGDRGEIESYIAMDKNYKVHYIDYLDKLYGHSRFNVSEKIVVIPFEFEDGHIIIPLKLNDSGKIVRFIFDTGADGMAIRKTLADSMALNITRSQNTSVVGGQMQVSISSGNMVHLTDNFSLKNQNIALFDRLSDGIDGIIGLNLTLNHITNINFDKKEITLSSFGDYKYENEGEIIPITNPSGVMLIPGTLNIVGKEDVKGDFIFDSGANYHLIAFSNFVRRNRLLLTGFKPEEQASTVSMGHATPVFKGKASKFQFSSNLIFTDMPVTLQASANTDNNVPDGSIGINLIKNFNVTIDLLKKEIFLSPRNI